MEDLDDTPLTLPPCPQQSRTMFPVAVRLLPLLFRGFLLDFEVDLFFFYP